LRSAAIEATVGKIRAYRRSNENLRGNPLKTFKSILPAAIGGLVLVIAGAAEAENLKFHCSNVASGASWDIAVDLDNRRVENLPATIDARTINWSDAENRTYELDRATGAMRMRNASSTGGYYLYYTCKPG
jgi:hypothetical protein